MPQMAPLNWVSLMILFLTLMMMLNVLNFFSFSKESKKNLIKKEDTKTSWKW